MSYPSTLADYHSFFDAYKVPRSLQMRFLVLARQSVRTGLQLSPDAELDEGMVCRTGYSMLLANLYPGRKETQ